jgi:hypothetical protein
MEVPILIVAPGNDLHAHAVVEALTRRHMAVEWVDFAALNKNLRLTHTLDGVPDARLVTPTGRTISLSAVKTIWWRRPYSPSDDVTFSEEVRTFVRGEWEHFIGGIEAFVSARWVNSPAANRLASRKGLQLVVAQKEGLRVPRTVITNDPEAVRTFARENPSLIYKRLGPAPRPITATKPLLPADLERLDTLCNCPAIFQEHIEARLDIRVTAIGTNLYAAEIDSQSGESPLDWRFDHTVPFRPHTLDSETSRRLRTLMQRLGLLYGAIDLRLTPQDEYVFLEINPNGQYLFIELLTQMPLSERMAEFLSDC